MVLSGAGIQEFRLYEVEPDHLWRLSLVEVAQHRIPRILMQIVHIFGFRDDGLAQRASRVPAFRRFFDNENNLIHDTDLQTSLP